MPDTIWPVSRSSRLIAEQLHSPVLVPSDNFRHLNGSSRVFAFLFQYLTPCDAFSVLLYQPDF